MPEQKQEGVEIITESTPVMDSVLERQANNFVPFVPNVSTQVFYNILASSDVNKSTISTSYVSYGALPPSAYMKPYTLERFYSDFLVTVFVNNAGTGGNSIRMQVKAVHINGTSTVLITEISSNQSYFAGSYFGGQVYTLKDSLLIPDDTTRIQLDFRSVDGSTVTINSWSIMLHQKRIRRIGSETTELE